MVVADLARSLSEHGLGNLLTYSRQNSPNHRDWLASDARRPWVAAKFRPNIADKEVGESVSRTFDQACFPEYKGESGGYEYHVFAHSFFSSWASHLPYNCSFNAVLHNK